MPQRHPQDVQSAEVTRPDMTLAYSALARRIAAIDAILRSNDSSDYCLKKIKTESNAAMVVIEQAEKVQLVIRPTSEEP